MKKTESGFTMIELLVGMLLSAVVVGGALMALMVHNRTHAQQNLSSAMEQNLRVGMEALTDTLRSAGYGVPDANLNLWIPNGWVSGFNANPTVNTGVTPNEISIARCTPMPIGTLNGLTNAGATTLPMTANPATGKQVIELLNAGNKRLIFIGDNEHAHVTSISTNNVNIDTDPETDGAQGTSRAYPAGTPVCRVDVLTFKIVNDSGTGIPQLHLDQNQGAGSIALAEGITGLTVDTVTALTRYVITLTARTEYTDPMTGQMLTRSLASDVALRNAL